MFKLFFDRVFYIVRKFIFSALTIYSFNLIVYPIGVIIPFNFFSIFIIMCCGFPAIFTFAIFLKFFL